MEGVRSGRATSDTRSLEPPPGVGAVEVTDAQARDLLLARGDPAGFPILIDLLAETRQAPDEGDAPL